MIRGYKAFDKDLKCRGLQFEVGREYFIIGKLKICNNGYHFCANLLDVYNYYTKESSTRICEVEAIGSIETESDKSATSRIKIIRELSSKEILDVVLKNNNSGYGNSGDGNSGNRNSGDWNSGDRNSGNRNSGDWNSGNRNSGYGNSGYGNSGYGNSGNRNSGNWNSGNRNSGYGNSGYGNSGNRNSGDWNSGDGNSGYFNTEIPLYFFNKPSTMKYTKELESKLRNLNVKPILTWVSLSNMTEQEKKDNPSSKITEGFLRKTDRMDWRSLTDSDKEFIKSLPNFDNEVFMKISNGISLLKNQIKVIVNGVEKFLDEDKAKELGII